MGWGELIPRIDRETNQDEIKEKKTHQIYTYTLDNKLDSNNMFANQVVNTLYFSINFLFKSMRPDAVFGHLHETITSVNERKIDTTTHTHTRTHNHSNTNQLDYVRFVFITSTSGTFVCVLIS